MISQDTHWWCLRDAPSDETGESATRQKCAMRRAQECETARALQIIRAERQSNGSCRSCGSVATLFQMFMSSTTLWLESASHSCPPLSARSITPYAAVRMCGFTVISDSAKAAAGSSPAQVRCPRGWDYLIPFPSSNGHGCRRRELSYDTASAMQNRVLRMVKKQ